jgi:integrase
MISLWLNAGRTLAFLADSKADLTVIEVCAAFWQHAKTHYTRADGSPTQELANYKRVIAPLRELFGRTPVEEFGPIKLKVVRDRLIADGLARETINHHVSRLRAIFRWGVANELVPVSVHQALSTVAGLQRGKTSARETVPVRPVADSVIEQTLAHLPEVVADMVRVQRLCGARPDEICALRPCDIQRDGEVWVYRPEHHKTAHRGRERVILFGPKAQAILSKYVARPLESFCFSPAENEASRRAKQRAHRKTPKGQGNEPGSNRKRQPRRLPQSRYTTNSYRRAIAYACESAFGMPDQLRYPHRQKASIPELADLRAQARAWRERFCWSPNQLRHTAATEIRRRFGLEAVQVVLGHASADISQVYAERDLVKAAEVAAKIG